MSEEGNTEDGKTKKPLSLKGSGRLELKKTVGAGQVRQSFSHGRSRSVAVEVLKKRSVRRDEQPETTVKKKTKPAKTASPPPVEATPETAEQPAAPAEKARAASGPRVVLRTLTDDEKAQRARAVGDAVRAEREARRVAEEEAKGRADEESRKAVEREEAERRQANEDSRRKLEDEERRKAEQDAARRLGEPETPADAASLAAGADTPAARVSASTAEEQARAKRRGEVRRPVATPRRGRDQRRRGGGKITVTEALRDDVGEARGRSLASLRRQRERERRLAQDAMSADDLKPFVREVVIPEAITVQELANRMAVRGVEVVKKLMELGTAASVAQTIDSDTAQLVVEEFGHKVKRVSAADVEIGLKGESDESGELTPRPPVVTVMGHVDHGKTSLLDALRKTNVVAGEAGGITQHIGAYQVRSPSGALITFIDTPGHAAFTQMRARGASVTDLVVLVVAADDGIMPQTIEAINHTRAANVPMIVAINKIDKPQAKSDRVRQELLQHEIVTEELGGDVQAVEISATENINLDQLEEAIALQAEVLELTANAKRSAEGVVVEARMDKGRGVMATTLVQRGTLRVGDIVVAGAQWGRVRAMLDDAGKNRKSAGPSTPVEVLGLNGVPEAGDEFVVVENERRAREVSEFRMERERLRKTARGPELTAEELFSGVGAEGLQELPVVVKADVQGSAEAIVGALQRLSTGEVAMRVLHSGVGGITESDVTLAGASNAHIIGFNVRANAQARELAARIGVEIRYYAVIYNVVDDIRGMLEGLLKPQIRERMLGNAKVLQVFQAGKTGKAAGCRVTDGVVKRGAKVRLLRDDIVIHDGALKTLRRFKDDVREVKEGYECGMSFDSYNDLREDDVLEFYELEEIARTLDA